MTTVKDVKDNHILTFGDTGYVLLQSNKIPEYFNWTLLAIGSDRDIRIIGKELENTVNAPEFDTFSSQLIQVIGGVANPTYTAAVGIAKFITQVISNGMQKNEDDQLGLLYMSLNRIEHYPHGERKKDGNPDLTGNMLIDYSLYGHSDTY